jgi:hypothetical protein
MKLLNISPVTDRILQKIWILNHNSDPRLICFHNVKNKLKKEW